MRCRADGDHIVEPILKYILSLFNIIGFVISIGYIIGGCWLIYIRNSLSINETEIIGIFTLVTDLGGYLIAIGVFGILFTIIGLAATLRENVEKLKLYLIVLIFMLLINLVIGIVFLIYSGKVTTLVFNKVNKEFVSEYADDDNVQTLVDFLQSEYSCCGIQSYTDWNSNEYYYCNSTTGSALACYVPPSCCTNYLNQSQTQNFFCSGKVLSDVLQVTNIYTTGCRQAIVGIAQYGIRVLASVVIGISIVLCITIILVQYLIILVRKEMALYNAKNKYLVLDEYDDSLNYVN